MLTRQPWLFVPILALALSAAGCLSLGPAEKKSTVFARATSSASPELAASPGITEVVVTANGAAPSPAVGGTAAANASPSPSGLSPQLTPGTFGTVPPGFPTFTPTTGTIGLPPIIGVPAATPLFPQPITPVPGGPEPSKAPGTLVLPTPTFTPVTVVNVPPTPRPIVQPPMQPTQPSSINIPAPGQPVVPDQATPIEVVIPGPPVAPTQGFTYPAVDVVNAPATPTPYPTFTPAPTLTSTPSPTWTPQSTYTPLPTYTSVSGPSGSTAVQQTATPYPTFTPQPTFTPVPINVPFQGTGDQTNGPLFLNAGALVYNITITPSTTTTGTTQTGPYTINLKTQGGSLVNTVGGQVSGNQTITSTLSTNAPTSDFYRVDVDMPFQEQWHLTVRQPP